MTPTIALQVRTGYFCSPRRRHFGAEGRRETLMSYLVDAAADRYRVIYTLPETNSLFSGKKMTLSHLKDPEPIPGNFGPLQIITAGDKKHARLVRQVEAVGVTRGAIEAQSDAI